MKKCENVRSKIKSLQELKKIVKLLKSEGKHIVLANGCFDVLHVGHIRYLEASKKLGDILIVALNSDSSMKAIKDPQRPIIGEKARAEIVASLSAVDYVTIFSEPTVDGLIRTLEPDVQSKGTDYSKDTVPEKETVHSYGGRVAIAGDRKAHATKDLIKIIVERYKKKSRSE